MRIFGTGTILTRAGTGSDRAGGCRSRAAVGTDQPARRRPEAFDRPGHSRWADSACWPCWPCSRAVRLESKHKMCFCFSVLIPRRSTVPSGREDIPGGREDMPSPLQGREQSVVCGAASLPSRVALAAGYVDYLPSLPSRPDRRRPRQPPGQQ